MFDIFKFELSEIDERIFVSEIITVKNPELLKVLSVKPELGQGATMHALPTAMCQKFLCFLIYTFPICSLSFYFIFQILSEHFLIIRCGKCRWAGVGLWSKVGHPACHHRQAVYK